MQRFALDESLLTGVPEIDEQHAELFAMFSDLHEAAAAGAAFLVLRNVLDRLASYVDHHFHAEQALMAQHAYPVDKTLEHAMQHAELRNRTHALLKEYRDTQTESIMPVALFLAEWMSDHIRKSDADLVAHVRASA